MPTTTKLNTPAVTVESLRTLNGAGNLKAFAVVNLGGRIRIGDVKVICQPNQKPWVAMPSKAYEVNGERRYSNTVEILDDALREAVSEVVLKEYAKLDAQTPAHAEALPW